MARQLADERDVPMTDERQEVDAELLARIATGDKQALTDLYVRYRVPLFQYLLHLVGDHGKAEELLQDTFLAVWRGARRYEGRAVDGTLCDLGAANGDTDASRLHRASHPLNDLCLQ